MAMLKGIEEALGISLHLPEQALAASAPTPPPMERHTLASDAGSSKLSVAEYEVLSLIGEGKTGRDIAKELHLSADEVHDHCLHIKRKFHLRNSAQLSHLAFRYMGTKNEELAGLNED